MITRVHSLESLSDFLELARRRYESSGAAAPTGREPAAGAVATEDAALDGAHAAAGYREEPESGRHPVSSPEVDAAWEQAADVFRDEQVVSGIATGWNRGGLLVRWGELQGFVPASQLKDVPIFEGDEARDGKLARWVGEELSLKIIELDRSRNRLVFSERATAWGPKDGDRLLQEVTPGETRRGHVSNLCDFGAFVDLGGVDGLIHLSELSWNRVSHPRELLEIGDSIEVYVISVDRDHRRIALSLKRTQPDPWSMVEQRYHVGQTLSAMVTNVVDFGAFAQIEDGLEGLIHISELADIKIVHPTQVINVGDRVQVRVLRIDSGNHRLALSMRQVAAEEPFIAPAPTAPKEAEWGNSSAYLY